MRVLVVVKSCQRDRDLGCHEAIRETWGSTLPDWVDVRFFIGGTPVADLKADEIQFSVADDYYGGLTKKSRMALQWGLDHGYDFLFCCDTDTYIIAEHWLKCGFENYDYCGNANKEFGHRGKAVIARMDGKEITCNPFYAYVGGGGYWLSKKALTVLMKSPESFLPEDWWPGQVFGPMIERGEIKAQKLKDFEDKAFIHFNATLHFKPRPNPADLIRGHHDKKIMEQTIEQMGKAIVSVGTGNRKGLDYAKMLDRLKSQVQSPRSGLLFFRNCLPSGCPPIHEKVAYKAYAIQEAIKRGATQILWLDASIMLMEGKTLEPIWEIIREQGYWFTNNEPYNCGDWTCDAALKALGVTREAAFKIPQISGAAFGLNLHYTKGQQFVSKFMELVKLPSTAPFCMGWDNDNQEVSYDPRVKGCRGEQSVSSILAHQLRMTLHSNKDYFYPGDYAPFFTDKTILWLKRGI